MSEGLEQTTLSGLCRFQKCREQYLDKIDKTDFSDTMSQEIFQAVVSLVEMQSPVTRDTLQSYRSGDAAFSMMVAFLFDNKIPELTDQIFTEFKSAGIRARTRLMGEYLVKNARNTTVPTSQLVSNAKAMFDRIEGQTVLGFEEPDQAVDSVIAKIDSWAAGGSRVVWGLPEVDEQLFLNSLEGYVVLAAPPSLGKTAKLCRILLANAKLGTASVFFSLEMSREDIYLRMAQAEPELRGRYITQENLKNPEFIDTLKMCLNRFKQLPIYIFDNIKSIVHMKNIARRLSVTKKVRIAAIDYLQLAGTDNPMDNDIVRVSKCSEIWKSLTMADLQKGYPALTAIALSQYNAEGQKDNSDRATTPASIQRRLAGATMRWSGQVRQDADIIMHLYTEDDIDNPAPLINLFCDKYRKWRRGWIVPMTFQKDRQMFSTPRSVEPPARSMRDTSIEI